MLDVMRKHASSWLIKAILGAIIVSFVFFFGYSSYTKGMKGGRAGAEGQVAAKVNGLPVSASEFEFFYDRNLEQLKSNFKDKEMPDFVLNMAQSSTLNQIVGREMALQVTDELGIKVPDAELADTIKKMHTDPQSGEFDPIAYRHQFLPYFKNRYGMDYEQFVRQDLRLQAMDSLFKNVGKSEEPTDEVKALKAGIWTFETVMIDPNALVASKVIASTEEATALAEKLAASNPKEWKKILKPYKVEPAKAGPMKISERHQLFGGAAPTEDFYAVFSLTKEKPIVAKPIQNSGKFYIVRLIEKKDDAKDSFTPAFQENFFQGWMSKLIAKAKIENFLEKK